MCSVGRYNSMLQHPSLLRELAELGGNEVHNHLVNGISGMTTKGQVALVIVLVDCFRPQVFGHFLE